MEDEDFSLDSLKKFQTEKIEKEKKEREARLASDPELRAIEEETKQVQKDTLVSTQSSVRMIKETVAVADKTNVQLKQQGEQLEHIQETAERADTSAQESYKSAKELHKYKGFLPISIKNMFKGQEKKHQDEVLGKNIKKTDKQLSKLEESRKEEQYRQIHGRNTPSPSPKRDHGDKVEQEIDDNLDEISMGLDHLKVVGSQMQEELQKQNTTIDRIQATTDHTDYTLNSANRKINEFL